MDTPNTNDTVAWRLHIGISVFDDIITKLEYTTTPKNSGSAKRMLQAISGGDDISQ